MSLSAVSPLLSWNSCSCALSGKFLQYLHVQHSRGLVSACRSSLDHQSEPRIGLWLSPCPPLRVHRLYCRPEGCQELAGPYKIKTPALRTSHRPSTTCLIGYTPWLARMLLTVYIGTLKRPHLPKMNSLKPPPRATSLSFISRTRQTRDKYVTVGKNITIADWRIAKYRDR